MILLLTGSIFLLTTSLRQGELSLTKNENDEWLGRYYRGIGDEGLEPPFIIGRLQK